MVSWFSSGPRHSVHDYAGVLVPLEQAHHHSHSARQGRTEFEASEEERPIVHDEEDGVDASKDAEDDDGDGGEEQSMLQMNAAEYTIEGLRKEMRKGRQGKWTTYESGFTHGR
jgi:hypothetical protein